VAAFQTFARGRISTFANTVNGPGQFNPFVLIEIDDAGSHVADFSCFLQSHDHLTADEVPARRRVSATFPAREAAVLSSLRALLLSSLLYTSRFAELAALPREIVSGTTTAIRKQLLCVTNRSW